MSIPKLNNMIELNKNTQKCVRMLTTYRLHGKLRRHATLRLLSLMLSQKLREMDEGVSRRCERERMRELLRPSVFGQVPDEDTNEYEDYHLAGADLVLMLVGFLRKSGVKDVEKLIRRRLEKE